MKRIGAKALGLDPGLANFGWCVMDLSPEGDRILEAGVIQTRKASRKDEVFRSSDTHRRGRELAGLLKLVLQRHDVVAVCAESLSFVRNSATMADVGRAWGIVDTFCTMTGLPLIEASPQHIKQQLCKGNRAASKKDVEEAVLAHCGRGEWIDQLHVDVRKSEHNHAYDAAGAILACRDSQVLTFARRMVSA